MLSGIEVGSLKWKESESQPWYREAESPGASLPTRGAASWPGPFEQQWGARGDLSHPCSPGRRAAACPSLWQRTPEVAQLGAAASWGAVEQHGAMSHRVPPGSGCSGSCCFDQWFFTISLLGITARAQHVPLPPASHFKCDPLLLQRFSRRELGATRLRYNGRRSLACTCALANLQKRSVRWGGSAHLPGTRRVSPPGKAAEKQRAVVSKVGGCEAELSNSEASS